MVPLFVGALFGLIAFECACFASIFCHTCNTDEDDARDQRVYYIVPVAPPQPPPLHEPRDLGTPVYGSMSRSLPLHCSQLTPTPSAAHVDKH